MMRHRMLPGAGIALGLAVLAASPAAAQNAALQADDIAYCKKLKDVYDRYLPSRSFSDQRGGSSGTETMVAVTMCDNGRHAEAIPHLEKVLQSNGLELPERAIGSRNR